MRAKAQQGRSDLSNDAVVNFLDLQLRVTLRTSPQAHIAIRFDVEHSYVIQTTKLQNQSQPFAK